VKELAGKTAFVTGAASGIGLGIATAFAQAGAKVMLCDIEEAALSAALKQLRLTNVDVDGVKADVSLKAELVAAAEATTARYGKVHILVDNGGFGGGGPYGTWSEASWNWTMGVNLMATIWGIEIFGPLIEQHGEGGHIVSTASIAGLIQGRACIQRLQVRRCRAVRGPAARTRAPRDWRIGAVSRGHPHSNHELKTQSPQALRGGAPCLADFGPTCRANQYSSGTHLSGHRTQLCR
jgi:NAD(P)-dependent dehydrogenase (short-subunit alcohol dehydrogenase family)